jgi:hypothetical protein
MSGAEAPIIGLRRRGAGLAAALLARAQTRLAARWQAVGAATAARDEGLGLSGPGLAARRRGTRHRLADPGLLWPGRDL